VSVFLFYNENKINGLEKALKAFDVQVVEKERGGNITFRVKDIRLHERAEVYSAIIDKFEKEQAEQLKGIKKICSVCGKKIFPY
jgi:hypothetical protein